MNLSKNFVKEPEVNIDEPFAGDLWGRRELGKKLTNFVSNLKCGATIALDAEWGAGKTWFMRNWKAELETQSIKVIYIDAFAYDFMEDPFLILSMEILNSVDAEKSITEKFKQQFVNTYHAILPHLPTLIYSLAMTLMGAGHFSKGIQDTFTAAKEAMGEADETAGELLEEELKEHLNELVENYKTSKNELKYFREELHNLVKDLESPLIFIVDELDRCKPEFSIKLIERIKHFFDIPNIVFILSTNKAQLEESINSYYGFKSANNYLEKFIDLNLKFPKKTHENYLGVVRAYTTKFNVSTNEKDILFLSNIFNLNSRELIKILQKIALLNINRHQVSPVMAFIYLAMEQKSMHPHTMSERDFMDNFIKLLRDYVINTPTFSRKNYNFENLSEFANQYADNYSDYDSGLVYILKLYYVLYTNSELEQHLQDLKKQKYLLTADLSNSEPNFVKSWNNYINSGFLL
ncbi:TPA: P-loop NTPase fold protein [Acinetobacter baumannii]|nr:KAP family NTPase [Acinetobacter baumannii]